MSKRKVYIIFNPTIGFGGKIIFASLSKTKRDTVFNELQTNDDLVCLDSSIGIIHNE